ncbi:unnamed protein product [Urochloa humidicola]
MKSWKRIDYIAIEKVLKLLIQIKLDLVREEISVTSLFSHPLLPLLDHAIRRDMFLLWSQPWMGWMTPLWRSASCRAITYWPMSLTDYLRASKYISRQAAWVNFSTYFT